MKNLALNGYETVKKFKFVGKEFLILLARVHRLNLRRIILFQPATLLNGICNRYFHGAFSKFSKLVHYP